MSTFDRVKGASNAQEAMLALAHALDVIQGELKDSKESRPSSDGWDTTWSAPDPQEDDWQPDPSVLRRLDELEAELAEASREDRVALESEQRLLKEQLKPPVVHDEGVGTRAKVAERDGETVVELPPVSDLKRKGREQFAADTLQFDVALGTDDEQTAELIRAYGKGGPLWLYYGNRDMVMGLNEDAKRIMVADVLEDSPQEANEMGRDILKDMDPGEKSFSAATFGNVS